MATIIPSYPDAGPEDCADDAHLTARRDIDNRLATAERPWIEKRRERYAIAAIDAGTGASNAPYEGSALTGLALSGGGIRSASFCLGILQFLSRRGLLKHFDYLSTVSGGGYIGSSLTWFLHGEHGLGAFDVGGNFPYGTASPRPSQRFDNTERLAYLRSHGMYLTPGNGITLLSGVAVVLRGLLLNLIVWVPIFAAVLAAAIALVGLGSACLATLGDRLCVQPAKLLMTPFFDGADCLLPRGDNADVFAFFVIWLLVLAVGIVMFLLACIVYSLTTATLGSRWQDEDRYRARRRFERAAGQLLLWGIVLPAVLVSLPLVHQWIQVDGAVAMITGGGASGVWSFLSSKASDKKESAVPLPLVAAIGAILLLYGFSLLSFSIAASTVATGGFGAWLGLGAAVLVALLAGYRVNINLIGLHRFYRDRLMEAFMPDRDTAQNAMAVHADRGMVRTMAAGPGGQPGGPYHLVNTNLIITQSLDRERRLRGGDSFVVSPLYCGSSATGWCSSEEYLHGSLSLATAMAISGAAANPNAAAGGVGPTRSIPVSMLMSLLNIRLGYFVPNPSKDVGRAHSWWSHRAHHFEPGFTAAVAALGSRGQDEKRRWLQLSDGGHFDNTGMYELFRRRVLLIMACDGSADPDYIFADAIAALERARTDFGITWQTDAQTPFAKLVPSEDMGFPGGAKHSLNGYAVIRFRYPADGGPNSGRDGLILYMTTTMIESLDEVIRGYKAANPKFPDQSTADQFFDERQFEAYRVLGWTIAEQMAAGTDIAEVVTDGKAHLVVRRVA